MMNRTVGIRVFCVLVVTAIGMTLCWHNASPISKLDAQYEIVKGVVSRPDFDAMAPIHRDMLTHLVESKLGSRRPVVAACWEGTAGNQATIEAFNNAMTLGLSSGQEYQQSGRWTSGTMINGSTSQGEQVTLTYSFAPDGTTVPGAVGEPSAPSNLFAWLNGIYGSSAVWQQIFHDMFQEWAKVTGVTYIFEPNDDGAAYPTNAGVSNVRGDIRIAAKMIDGNGATVVDPMTGMSSFVNILAYNHYPNDGDMLLDSADSFFDTTSNDSQRLRNVASHEHGHGLGMLHVCPISQTKLMEPVVSTAFDGPQFDDILNGQRHYGDAYEPNDTPASAYDLGYLTIGHYNYPRMSIDGIGDIDYYKFSIASAQQITATLKPVGSTYLQSPQTAACNTGTPFDPMVQADLTLLILDSNGSTVLASSNQVYLGQVERIPWLHLPTAGTYYVQVFPNSVGNIQAYELEFSILAPPFEGPATYAEHGTGSGQVLGTTVSGGGDVNGDGYSDFLITVGKWYVGTSANDDQETRVYSGFSGALLHSFTIPMSHRAPERGAAFAGDLNGDGYDDILIPCSFPPANWTIGDPTGRVLVYSGASFSLMYDVRGSPGYPGVFGMSPEAAGDVNGDGYDDFVVGFLDNVNYGSGYAQVFSGVDGSVIHTLLGNHYSFGWAVAGAGDVNADGFDDVIVGAYLDSFAGTATVFSGVDGSVIHSFVGVGPPIGSWNSWFGWAVAGAGDVNADGFDDVIVGEKDFAVTSPFTVPFPGSYGRAVVYSGVDGSVLHQFYGSQADPTNFGWSVDGAGDVNGDGFDDIVVGETLADVASPFDNAGRATVFSGADGSLLMRVHGAAGDNCGRSVSGAGDINGDGFSDVIVGLPFRDSNGTDSGTARVYCAPSLPVLKYRTKLGLLHRLDLDWLPTSGDPNSMTGTIECNGATPGGIGLYGVSLASIDYPAFGYLPILVAIDSSNLISTGTFGFSSMGDIAVAGVSRQFPFIAGSKIHIQFFETSPIISSSPAIRVEIVP